MREINREMILLIHRSSQLQTVIYAKSSLVENNNGRQFSFRQNALNQM